MDVVDYETGEVREAPPIKPATTEKAANGELVVTIAHSGGQVLDLFEDGELGEEFRQQMSDVARRMSHITNATGSKCSGEVTLKIKLTKDGDHFTVLGDVKSKPPTLPRPKSVVWQDEAGDFTRFPPNQTQMFGTRRTPRNI